MEIATPSSGAEGVADSVIMGFKRLQSGSPPPGLSADESKAFGRLAFLFEHGLPMFSMMALALPLRTARGLVDTL
jgi:hypothetical protein